MHIRRLASLLVIAALLAFALPTQSKAAPLIVPPPNDDFDYATLITSLPYQTSQSTTDATPAGDDPFACFDTQWHSVWFQFTPAQNVLLVPSTAGSNYGPNWAVYTGARGALNQVTCSYYDSGPILAMANTTYYIIIGDGFYGSGGNLVFSLNAVVVPPNDDFDNAKVIPAAAMPFTYQDSLDTTAATTAVDDPGCGNKTVWYKFTSPSAARISVDTSGGYGTILSVFTGVRGALSPIVYCSDLTTNAFAVAAGTTYYIVVASNYGNYGGSSVLVLNVQGIAPPPNDDFAHATVITTLPYNTSENTIAATTAADDPAGQPCVYTSSSVWFSYTPTQDMFVQASNSGSDYASNVSVFTGSRGALTLVTSPCGGPGTTSFTAHAGITYYFMVGGFFGTGGNLMLSVTGNPSLKVSVAVNPTDLVDQKTGVATLRGTVTCSRPASVSVTGNLQQPIGRINIVTGNFSITIPNCSGVTQWTVTVTPTNGKYAGGAATTTASVAATDSATAETANASAKTNVQLNGKK